MNEKIEIMIKDYSRTGSFEIDFSKDEIFPLLCPKMEEKWIPNWECKVLFSLNGYNETGAVFKTEKAFGTELIWYTNMYDKDKGKVEFTNFSNDLIFNFIIYIHQISTSKCKLDFIHKFKALSNKGIGLINLYQSEDFQDKLLGLGRLMTIYLKK